MTVEALQHLFLEKSWKKTIFYVLSTISKGELIKDKTDDSFLGLEAMINICSREKINGGANFDAKNCERTSRD